METTEFWVQAALFPEFPTVFYAYEFEFMGRWWDIYDDANVMVASIDDVDFADFLDFAREINYDVCLFTYDSWIALEEVG